MPVTSRNRRTAVAIVLAAVASMFALVADPAPVAAAAPPVVTGEPCTPGQGVTVVVDHQNEGDVRVGCAEGEQATGFDALTAAGFTYNEDIGPSSALCQIGGVPSTIEPDCWATGYWAYWKSDGTAAWDYSPVGAGGGPVTVGTVEGWSWTEYEPGSFDGKLPRIAIADLGSLFAACDGLLAAGGEDAALAWTGCELERNGGTFPGFAPGTPDFGLTLDAVMAYALDGRAWDPRAVAALDIVDARILEYVSDLGFGDGTTERYAGALAKSTLAFSLAGRDINDVGGLDLEAELRARLQTTGPDAGRFSDHSTWGDYSNGFGQALAILALSHTDDGVPAPAVTFLLAQQCPDGGFRGGYSVTGGCTTAADSDTDYTAFALQALLSAEQSGRVKLAQDRAAGFLVAKQDAAGGVTGTGVTAGANANSTALAAQSFRPLGLDAAADKAEAWVRSVQVDAVAADGGPAAEELGAIGYNSTTFDAAIGAGIADGSRDQWRRSTVQGLLAFDAPTYGVPGEEPASAPFDTWVAFVNAQYRDLVGRAPSVAERNAAVAALDGGTLTKGAFIDSLVSVNPNSVESKIFRLYFGLLDRTPTPANLELWKRRFAAGWTTPQAAGAYLDTPDSPFRNTTNDQFVRLLYQRVMGRTPSAASIAPWSTKLRNGSWTRARMAGFFVDSGEHRARTAGDLRVMAMDRGMFGWVPGTVRFFAQRDALRAGTKTFAQLAEEVLVDPKYLDRVVPAAP